ncbi:MAG: TraV family lipoprotein [Alphaproteobacteria bacterium]|nr:TraV family lipoprotein [Alphaproteobacteria bacterium]
MKNLIILCLSIVTCLLSGCTAYEESFSSEPGKGSGWKSMSETYAIGRSLNERHDSKPSAEKPIPIESDGSLKRLPEEFLSVWFAPFEDADHNLYAESSVMTIVKQSQWII